MPGNPRTLGLGAVAATPAMVLHILCTGVIAGAGWNVSAGTVSTVVVDAGRNAFLLLGVPVVLAWRAGVDARQSEATFSVPRWGSRSY